MFFNKDKDEQKLLQRIVDLSPEEFVALAKVLDVKMSIVDKETGKFTLRDAEEILVDIVREFRKLKHRERQIVLKAMLVHKPTTDTVEETHDGSNS